MARKKKPQFDRSMLIARILEAIKNGEETWEQLEYTLKKDPKLLQDIKDLFKTYPL